MCARVFASNLNKHIRLPPTRHLERVNFRFNVDTTYFLMPRCMQCVIICYYASMYSACNIYIYIYECRINTFQVQCLLIVPSLLLASNWESNAQLETLPLGPAPEEVNRKEEVEEELLK